MWYASRHAGGDMTDNPDNVVDLGARREEAHAGTVSIFVQAINSLTKARADEVRNLQRAVRRKARQRKALRAKIARWERVSQMNAWPERGAFVAAAVAYVEALERREELEARDPLLSMQLWQSLREAKAAYLTAFDAACKPSEDRIPW